MDYSLFIGVHKRQNVPTLQQAKATQWKKERRQTEGVNPWDISDHAYTDFEDEHDDGNGKENDTENENGDVRIVETEDIEIMERRKRELDPWYRYRAAPVIDDLGASGVFEKVCALFVCVCVYIYIYVYIYMYVRMYVCRYV